MAFVVEALTDCYPYSLSKTTNDGYCNMKKGDRFIATGIEDGFYVGKCIDKTIYVPVNDTKFKRMGTPAQFKGVPAVGKFKVNVDTGGWTRFDARGPANIKIPRGEYPVREIITEVTIGIEVTVPPTNRRMMVYAVMNSHIMIENGTGELTLLPPLDLKKVVK